MCVHHASNSQRILSIQAFYGSNFIWHFSQASFAFCLKLQRYIIQSGAGFSCLCAFTNLTSFSLTLMGWINLSSKSRQLNFSSALFSGSNMGRPHNVIIRILSALKTFANTWFLHLLPLIASCSYFQTKFCNNKKLVSPADKGSLKATIIFVAPSALDEPTTMESIGDEKVF